MIKWDRAGMAKIDSSMIKAIEMTADTLRDEVREEMIVPRALGTLQNEGFDIDYSGSKNLVVRLIFNTPYARRLYFHPEYNFRMDQNPNAQGEWMAPWMAGGKYEDRAGEIFAHHVKGVI